MRVARLGVSPVSVKTGTGITRKLPTKPYLLFIGGIDKGRRRAVDDLVAAYNNMKAEGQDIQLVLVGENFQEVSKIPDEIVRAAVAKSSYSNDILLYGYIDDDTKHALFKGAIAFVYPTRYEGFGIPVLEGMLHECPVVTYKNSSLPEVGGKYALYAHDWESIKKQVEEVMSMKTDERRDFITAAKKHAESFTWEATAQAIYDELLAKGD